MDLSGQPRDLNIGRAMENLFFERKGEYVTEKPEVEARPPGGGDDWQTWHLPTHETHMYDVHRHVIKTSATILTGNRCLVMNLVDGDRIMVETEIGI
ncbi:MAG: hypothetical protein R2758_09635 [Bacteroidales bacterium]